MIAYIAGLFVMGMAYAAALTPSGLMLRRSAQAEDRRAVFAAQFALSHACWLIAYPLAGQIGARFGQQTALFVLAALAAFGVAAALWLWPARDPQVIEHEHPDLFADLPLRVVRRRMASASGRASLSTRWRSGIGGTLPSFAANARTLAVALAATRVALRRMVVARNRVQVKQARRYRWVACRGGG